MSRLLKSHLGYTGYFQLYNVPFNRLPLLDYSEKKDIYQPGGLINGTPTVFDHLRRRKMPYSLSDWRRPEMENINRLSSDIETGDIEFAYLYLADLDGILHREGTHSPRVARKVEWYDAQLKNILSKARSRYDDVELHLFSDHGMTDVTEHVNLMARIESLGLIYGQDYAAIYDSTMARFYFHNQRAETLVRSCLEDQPLGQVLSDEWLREAGAFFPDQRYGELFFLLDPGVLCVPSYMGERAIAGMHGYDPQHEDSTATFASTREMSCPPKELADIYDLMCEVIPGQRFADEIATPSSGASCPPERPQ